MSRAARRVRPHFLPLLLILFLVGSSVVSIFVGVGDLTTGSGDGPNLIWTSRLPRTAAVLLTGASLAIAGLVMQTLARNRFVDPMIAGTGQSAALGILAMTFFAPGAPLILKVLIGSFSAFLGTAVFLALTRRLPPAEPHLVPLFAIVYGGIVGALATAFAWHTDLLQFLDIWMNGEFSGVMKGRYETLWGTAILVIIAWWVADRLTILSLGRNTSIGLGLNYATVMQIGLVIVSLIAGFTVATIGVLPFVGLVVPAIVSRMIGDDVRTAIPLVATGGAAIVLLSDLVGRIIRFPYEIPAGTILGVLGAMAFLGIIFNRAFRHA